MGDLLGELTALASRPPTPPKDAEVDTVGKLLDYTNYLPNPTRQAIATPDDSPSSSAEYSIKTSDKFSKRVDFSPWVSYTPPSISAKGIRKPDQHIRLLPPSKECRSSKSILKPYDPTSYLEYIGVRKEMKSLPEMLEDMCRELASTSRSPRLDAYMALNDCLKAYKDVPDRQALEDKLPLLTGFIRRDLLTNSGAMDVQLMTQALKLLTTLVWTIPSINPLLPDDFCAFVVDRAITTCGESQNVSKAIISHYLHLLSIQKFSPKIMTNDRVGRLLDTIQEIHVKGNGIVGQRLIVYRRLLSQARSLMGARASDWVDHLFTGMLSTLKEIRRHALDFGLEVALNLGSVSQTSRCVLEIFDRRSAEGKRFRDLLLSRLNDMIESPEERSHVPPIWSIVILFFQNRRNQFEHWEHMRDWLSIIQKCFNKGDKKTKFQATLAWNRLIYTVNPDVTTKNPIIQMLRRPMLPLDRKTNTKKDQVQAKASSSYCTLLYYAFRPGSPFEQLDRFWGECIDPILPACLSASETDTIFACQILISLLGDDQQKPWTENRGHEGHIIKPEELPRLDPKWIRLRAGAITNLFDVMFISEKWQTASNGEDWILRAWSSFTKALGDAGSKEVKISTESFSAVAHIMNSIKLFWSYSNLNTQTPPMIKSIQTETLPRLVSLVKIAMENLGHITFTEKRLTRGTDELFEAAETPSGRTNRIGGILSSPIVHLIEMLASSVSIDEVQELFQKTISDWIQVAIRGSTLRQNKFKILHELAFLNMTATARSPEAKLILWQLILEFIDLRTAHLGSKMDIASASPGLEYRDVVKILEIGIRLGFEPSQSWPTLIQTIVENARQEIGVEGVAIVIIEPLASSLNQEISNRCSGAIFRCCAAVLQNTAWPRSRKEMEHAHRVLWGVITTSMKANPFDQLYLLTESLLLATYRQFHGNDPSNINEVLRASISVVSSCPSSLSAVLLQRIQSGLAKWLEDADGLMNGSSTKLKEIFLVVQQLGTAVVKSIEALPNFDSKHLSAIEILIIACLSSRHKSIANESITLWNHTFGASVDIEYSAPLRRTLSRLNKYTDILMQEPNLEQEIESESSPFNFIETQYDIMNDTPQDLENKEAEEMDLPGSRSKISPGIIGASKTHEVKARRTPEPLKDDKGPKTLNPRLHHENSQIEFAAIESSPFDLDALESQFLTRRQKEVKDRQQQEAAAMFPDLRSSPRSKSRGLDQDLPKLYRDSRRTIGDQDLPDEMSSPILPPADSRMIDTFVGSSPTPRSKRHSASKASQLDDEDPPSSPPALARLTTALHRTDSSNSPKPLVLQPSSAQSPEQISEGISEWEALSRSPVKSANAIEVGQDQEVELPNMAIAYNNERASAIDSSSMLKIGDDVSSDMNSCVDAESNPSSSNSLLDSVPGHPDQDQRPYAKDVNECVATQVSLVKVRQSTNEVQDSQIHSQNIVTPDEQVNITTLGNETKDKLVPLDPDEQISAQIAMDMERALSQADQSFMNVSSNATKSTSASCKKKRKRGTGVPVRSSKRHKSLPSKVQVLVERRQSPVNGDEELYDCIVVTPQSDKERENPPIFKKRPPQISTHTTMSATNKRKSSNLERPVENDLGEAYTRPSKKRKADSNNAPQNVPAPGLSTPAMTTGRRTNPRRRSSEDNMSRDDAMDAHASLTTNMLSPKAISSNLPMKDDTPTKRDKDKMVIGPLPLTVTAEPQLLKREPGNEPARSRSTSMLPRHECDTSMKVQRASELEVPETNPLPDLPRSGSGGDAEGAEEFSDMVEENPEDGRSKPVTEGEILARLKLILKDAIEDVKRIVLGPTEVRDVMSSWMDLGREIHEAGDRGSR